MQQFNLNLANRIEEEQATLRSMMDSISTTLTLPPDGDFDDWKLEVVWELRDFRNSLVKHFDLEEDGGFMRDVVDTAPREKRRVDLLAAEHVAFLRELESITSELKRTFDSSGLHQTRERMSRLVERLHDHEASERDLIALVYFQDLGSND